jgi:polyvinyl alcohol dehydrogenase (cytochrome)
LIRTRITLAAFLLASLLAAVQALAATPQADAGVKMTKLGLRGFDPEAPGAPLYQSHCASCHNNGVARAPNPRMLQFLSPGSIYRTLTTGVMQPQAAALSDMQKRQVAEYLTNVKLTEDAIAPKLPRCSQEKLSFDANEPAEFPNWGLGYGNKREVSTAHAGFGAADISRLELKWAFAYPNAQRARSHPLLAAGAIFMGSQDGTVFALDRETGCVKWTFIAATEVRTGIVMSEPASADGMSRSLFFGDLLGNVYAIDAFTGKLQWRVHPDDHPGATITGTPTLYKGRLHVPVSSLEVVSALNDNYACCTFRGSVVTLDARSGEKLWQTHTIFEAPKRQGANAAGADWMGPSGAPVWNSPAIDEKRGQLYVGTGENYSSPATGTSDSIIAMDLATGKVRWVYQATPHDAWNSACAPANGANCPKENGPDFDFGASMVLATHSSGREFVIGPQKSGVVHAVDPDTGALVWKTKLGRGGLHGGVHFGLAVSGDRVFAPISDASDGREHREPPNPGLYGLDLRTGEVLWRQPMADECAGREFCAPGIGAAITATPELVLAGALDGYLRIHDARTGELLRKIDTTQTVKTIDGSMAHGGSMDGATAPLPSSGELFVNSGYNFAGHMPGNVLLVYGLRRN